MRVILLIALLCSSVAGQAAEPLPGLSLPTLKGQKLGSKDFEDNIVVLDFWATWCQPCVGEIPAFKALQDKYASRGVKVIGLAVQSGWRRDIQKFAAKYKCESRVEQ